MDWKSFAFLVVMTAWYLTWKRSQRIVQRANESEAAAKRDRIRADELEIELQERQTKLAEAQAALAEMVAERVRAESEAAAKLEAATPVTEDAVEVETSNPEAPETSDTTTPQPSPEDLNQLSQQVLETQQSAAEALLQAETILKKAHALAEKIIMDAKATAVRTASEATQQAAERLNVAEKLADQIIAEAKGTAPAAATTTNATETPTAQP